ncbi:phosphatases II, partial [Martensiomyces pterosporus]
WSYEDRYEGQPVIPHLILGPYHLVRKRDFLARYSITHILCIRDPSETRFLRDPQLPGIELKFMDVPADVRKENIIPHFSTANQWMAQILRQGGTVLVCCSDGIDKSTAFVSAYLMNTFALAAVDAVTFVQNHRYCATPSSSGYRVKLVEYEPICVAQRQFVNQAANGPSERNLRRRADDDE